MLDRSQSPAALLEGAVSGLFGLLVQAGLAFALGVALALVLRRRGLRWTWPACGLIPSLALWSVNHGLGSLVAVSATVATLKSLRWHRADVRTGGNLAARAGERLGPSDVVRRLRFGRALASGGFVDERGLLVGADGRGIEARIPFNDVTGSHTLVVGATGSGKTVTQGAIVVRTIAHGHGAIVVDPKGDPDLREQLLDAARAAGRPFLEWSPDGPAVYNPYGEGADTELVDKALAAETYTEPHYLRQAQRYLGHAIRAMRAAHVTISPRALVRYLDPLQLEILARDLTEDHAKQVWAYLDSLSARQQRDLAGTRDRLGVLSESDVGRWLEPQPSCELAFELDTAIRWRAIVLFRLEADRRPLLAQMLGAAIVQDLLAVAARHQADPIATVAMIDEFSALANPGIARLFARTRAAGVSLLLGTQELADLRIGPGPGMLDQVLGNIGALIAHRQVVPQSAELVAGVAGSQEAWAVSQRTVNGLTGTRVGRRETRVRHREPVIPADDIKQLATGNAAVIVPAGGDRPRIVQILRATVAREGESR